MGEPIVDFAPSPLQGAAGVFEHLGLRTEPEIGVRMQPLEDLFQGVEVEGSPTDVDPLCCVDLGGPAQADVVDLLSGNAQLHVLLDQVGVDLLPAGDPDQTASVVGAGYRREVLDEAVAVCLDCGSDHPGDQSLRLLPPGLPVSRDLESQKGVVAELRDQVTVELAEHPVGRGSSGGHAETGAMTVQLQSTLEELGNLRVPLQQGVGLRGVGHRVLPAVRQETGVWPVVGVYGRQQKGRLHLTEH